MLIDATEVSLIPVWRFDLERMFIATRWVMMLQKVGQNTAVHVRCVQLKANLCFIEC